ncbi:MAG: glycosyltransferase family 4 protein [Methanomassiliicoccales archaeon]|jgi:glycosyltransferase involved in cell wall biosynthesis
MRILQVLPFYTPSLGGAVIAPYNLIRALKQRGHEITVITTDFELDAGFARSIEGVEVIPFSCKAYAGMLYSPEMGSWLKDRVKEFDLVHAQNYRTYQNILVRKHCLRSGIPYILQAHGSLPSDLGKGTIKQLYDIMWGRNIVLDASRLIAVSDIEARSYSKLGAPPSRIDIIPNAVRARTTSLPKGTFRGRVGAGDRKVVLFLGRLNRLKGLLFLLRSFGRLQMRKDILLVITGPSENNHREELETEAIRLGLGESIVFSGDVSDVASAYQDADVLVYPSSYEVFGMVPFEALLSGTPIIVTSNTGCGEIVQREGCGLVVPYGDELAMANAIEHALTSPQEMEEMVVRGRKFVTNELNVEKIVKRFEQTYQNCIRDH